jgi:PKD repeat protein
MEKRIPIIGLILLISFSSIVPISAGYDVKIPNIKGQSFKSNIGSPPVAKFEVNPPVPLPGELASYRAKDSYDPDGYIVLYEWDWDNDGIYDEYHTIPTAVHVFDSYGKYQVTLRVTDNKGLNGTKTNTVVIDNPPLKPLISGPSNGTTWVDYIFTFNGIDPDGDDVYYDYWIWQDFWHYDEGTIGPFPSGTNGTTSWYYKKTGTYVVEARTKDIYGKASDWSEFYITIPRTRTVCNSNWFNFLNNYIVLRWFVLRITNS